MECFRDRRRKRGGREKGAKVNEREREREKGEKVKERERGR